MPDSRDTVRELIIGGFWVASAIQVFVFTWEAYSGEFKNFPGIGGGDTQTFNPAKPPDVAPRINQDVKTIAEGLKPPDAIISKISTLYNQKKNLDPGVNMLVRYALQQYPNAPQVDVLTAVIIYVQGHWPGGKFTHTVGPDPSNPVKIPNWIFGKLFGKANKPNKP